MIFNLIALAMTTGCRELSQTRIDWTSAYDGRRILTEDGMGARLWDANTGRLLQSFTGLKDFVSCVAFTPNGKQVLTATGGPRDTLTPKADFAIQLWDIASGKLVRRLSTLTGSVWSLLFSPDGKRLLCLDGSRQSEGVIEWDLATGRELVSFDGVYARKFMDTMPPITFGPDGRTLLAIGMRNAVIRDSQTGKVITTFADPRVAYFTTAVYSHDGKEVLTAGIESKPQEWSSRHVTSLWNAKTGALIRDLGEGKGGIVGAFFSDRKDEAAVITEDWLLDNPKREVQRWNTATGTKEDTTELPNGIMLIASVANGSRCLISCQNPNKALAWKAASHSLTAEIENADPVGFSPDGRNFLVRDSAFGADMSIWNSDNGQKIKGFRLRTTAP